MESSRARLLKAVAESYHGALLRFLWRRLGDPDDAEEVAQEAYLRLLQADRYDGRPGLLFRTAGNLAIDRLRSRERRVRLQARHPNPLLERTSRLPSPEEAVRAKEQADQVTRLIRQLPDKCRKAFILHRFEGRSYAEIAEELGVSRSMVEKYLIRALDHLRTGLLGRAEGRPAPVVKPTGGKGRRTR